MTRILAVTAALLAACSVAAQEPEGRGDAALRARTRDFLRAVGDDSIGAVRRYFPRRGEWTWIRTEHGPGFPRMVGTWRFAGTETLRAIRGGSPVCTSFDQYARMRGSLVETTLLESSAAWRHVRGTRFAPRASSRRPYTYIEWKREDGAWVIATLADEAILAREPRVLPAPQSFPTGRREVARGRAGVFAPSEGYAAGEPWYEDHGPIMFDGYRYFKHGRVRALGDQELARVGSLGSVALYVEAESPGTPDHLYIPVRRGEYVPYQISVPHSCYRD